MKTRREIMRNLATDAYTWLGERTDYGNHIGVLRFHIVLEIGRIFDSDKYTCMYAPDGFIELGINDLTDSQALDILYHIIDTEFKCFIYPYNMFEVEYEYFMNAKERLKVFLTDKYFNYMEK